MNMKSHRVHAHQEALKAGTGMNDKPTGESDAASMKLGVANPDSETARRRGLGSFDWRAEVGKRSRLNHQQVGPLSPPWRRQALQNAGPRMEEMRQPILLPPPNPQPMLPTLGALPGPEPHPFDRRRILPRPPPRPMPNGATRRRINFARTLPGLKLPVTVEKQRQKSMQSLERLSLVPASQSKPPRSNEGGALGSTVTSQRKVFLLEEDGQRSLAVRLKQLNNAVYSVGIWILLFARDCGSEMIECTQKFLTERCFRNNIQLLSS